MLLPTGELNKNLVMTSNRTGDTKKGEVIWCRHHHPWRAPMDTSKKDMENSPTTTQKRSKETKKRPSARPKRNILGLAPGNINTCCQPTADIVMQTPDKARKNFTGTKYQYKT